MALIDWDDGFTSGAEELDEHAKQFVSLLNLINEDFSRGVSAGCMAALLSTLASLSQFHFEYEECWMQKIHFPGLPTHREDHAAFMTRVASSRDLPPGDLREFLDFLSAWARRHFSRFHADLKPTSSAYFGR